MILQKESVDMVKYFLFQSGGHAKLDGSGVAGGRYDGRALLQLLGQFFLLLLGLQELVSRSPQRLPHVVHLQVVPAPDREHVPGVGLDVQPPLRDLLRLVRRAGLGRGAAGLLQQHPLHIQMLRYFAIARRYGGVPVVDVVSRRGLCRFVVRQSLQRRRHGIRAGCRGETTECAYWAMSQSWAANCACACWRYP